MKHNILKQIEWPSLIFLTATPIAAIATGIWYFQTETFNPWMLAVFFFFYHATGMSVTAGYHRLFAHKAYEANKFVKALYLFFGAGAFQNSTRKWVIDHRIHHRYVDEEQDPYCINKGFWYAHFLWMCKKEDWRSTTMGNGYARDIDKDPMIVFQDKYYIPIASVSCFVVPALVGWAMGSWLGGLFFGGTLRLVVVHHCTFFVINRPLLGFPPLHGREHGPRQRGSGSVHLRRRLSQLPPYLSR